MSYQKTVELINWSTCSCPAQNKDTMSEGILLTFGVPVVLPRYLRMSSINTSWTQSDYRHYFLVRNRPRIQYGGKVASARWQPTSKTLMHSLLTKHVPNGTHATTYLTETIRRREIYPVLIYFVEIYEQQQQLTLYVKYRNKYCFKLKILIY